MIKKFTAVVITIIMAMCLLVTAPVPASAFGETFPLAQQAIKVTGTYSSITAIDSQNKVLSWGSCKLGRLGNGEISDNQYSTPIRTLSVDGTGNLSNIVAVESRGAGHCLALDYNGNVYAWGSGSDGVLGNGETNHQYIPVRVLGGEQGGEYLSDIAAISANSTLSMALDKNGYVYTWGSNQYNQIGNGKTGSQFAEPARVLAVGESEGSTNYLQNIVAISAGKTHCLALDSSGNVYSWGIAESKGVLGNYIEDSPVPTRVLAPGEPEGSTNYLSNIVAIAAGNKFSLALTENGQVLTWGWDNFDTLGNGQNVEYTDTPQYVVGVDGIGTLSNIKAISAGPNCVAALDNDGSVYTWGWNYDGQLGNGYKASSDLEQFNTPQRVLDVDGTGHLTGVTEISIGHCFCVAIKGSKMYAWGSNSYGVLGSGCTEGYSLIPVEFVQPVPIAKAHFGGENGTELFLHGEYIELGISNWGDFGTLGSKPAGFRGTSLSPCIGMSADHDGFFKGKDMPIDYYLPGEPEERFVVGYRQGGSTHDNTNCAQGNDKNMPSSILNLSKPCEGILKAKIVTTWDGVMEITQIISFREGIKFYRNEVTIKNLSGQEMTDVRFMRTFDPDNTCFLGGMYETQNDILLTHEAGDGKALVRAQTFSDNDPLYTALGTRAPIFFYSDDIRAKVSTFGFSNKDPYTPLAYDSARPKGYSKKSDTAISITCDIGTLADETSSTRFIYYTSLDDRDYTDVIADIEDDPTVPTDPTIGESGDTYTVTFVDHDGSTLNTLSVVSGLPATFPANPTREGYEFRTWQIVGSGDLSSVTQDITVKAVYEILRVTGVSINDKSVTTIPYDGSLTLTATVSPANAKEKGIVWISSDESKATIDQNGVITMLKSGDATFTVKTDDGGYTDSHTVTIGPFDFEVSFNDNLTGEVIAVPADTIGTEGNTVPAPSDNNPPTRTGYTFEGWFKESACTNEWVFGSGGSIVEADIILYAKWTPSSDTAYIVNHYKQNIMGSGYTVAESCSLTGTTATVVNAAAKSYTGFTENTTHALRKASGVIAPDGSLVLNLYYDREVYTVDYDINYPSSYTNSESIRYGEKTTPPSNPSRPGYRFDGWCEEAACENAWDFDTLITQDTTLYAKWTKIFNVTFDDNVIGAEIEMPDDQIIDEAELITEPTSDPVRNGYQFGGWFTDTACEHVWDFDTDAVNENMTLYAKWTAIEYDISYYLNGGVNGTNPLTYTIESELITFADPTKQGYVFDGWYTDTDCTSGNMIEKISAGSMGKVTVYAKWVDPIPDSGTVPSDAQYGSISAIIRDADGNPLVNYQVDLHSKVVTGVTDKNGRVTFNNVPLVNHTLVVKDNGNGEIGRVTFNMSKGTSNSAKANGSKVDVLFDENAVSVNIEVTLDKNDTAVQKADITSNPATGGTGLVLWIVAAALIALGAVAVYVRKRLRIN